MRVIEPRYRPSQAKSSNVSKKHGFVVIAVLLIASGAYLLMQRDPNNKQANNQTVVAANQTIKLAQKNGKLKQFTGQQFRDLYNNFAYPNTQRIGQDTPITGNEVADTRIRTVAEARGYQIRSAPVTNTFRDVGDTFVLQQRAAQPWLDMKAAAAKDGISLGLTAGYRSAEDQKQLFLQRLNQIGLTPDAIASGAYDAQVSQILRATAIPGYSRHHTGYTIDIACKDQPTTSFEYTVCFKWLQANNYEHAKQHGWIPSYPEGTANQGPDPESWEYVWVGMDAVTE